MILAGAPLPIIAKVLGHTVATLEDTYAHILDDDTRVGLAASPNFGPESAANPTAEDAAEQQDAAA